MEIIDKSKGHGEQGEIVSVAESESNVREEVNKRTYKAGYTDRDGQPKISRNDGAGKGDVPRSCNKALYDKNYERIFGKK